MTAVRRCQADDGVATLAIINSAAEIYRGVIPADCWHEPYMDTREFANELSSGVEFWGYEAKGRLVGVMGIQSVRDVDLIRHAYVLSTWQRHGIGAALIGHLRRLSSRQMLVGTWAAATWAISFYRRYDFHLLDQEHGRELLSAYWQITARQLETSVVLANPRLEMR